ncbi:MAG: hypothetical protein HY997_23520 [Mycolicibacterium neoaurum]|nr:hypothetical protein [Mycolicibacterium neoaurum]
MTELDLGLKVATRRLFWRMGFSTRIDVPLRSFAPTSNNRRGQSAEAYTDLDVLGLTITSGFRLHAAIADCKSGRNASAIERIFWLRGVADFFSADDAWTVREHAPPDAARQLAARLGIAVLTSEDLTALEQFHPSDLPIEHPALARLFDRHKVANYLTAFTGLSKKLKPLLDYRQFDYFVYEPYRNPLQLIAHLQQASDELDPKNPLHVALFFDMAWLYLVTITQIVEHVRASRLGDPDTGTQEYLFGGRLGLREKQLMATLLAQVAPQGTDPPDPLPPYYPQLREQVVRVLRRPNHILNALRYAEVATAGLADRVRVRIRSVFGDQYDEIAAKLLNDVCKLLVSAGELSSEFRDQANAILLGVPTTDDDDAETSDATIQLKLPH